jgi:hypothetical protein
MIHFDVELCLFPLPDSTAGRRRCVFLELPKIRKALWLGKKDFGQIDISFRIG